MSQTALANLLISIGAHSAINFDGGGSTEMVTRNDAGNIEITNTPSDGGERNISTALGVKSVGVGSKFSSMTLSVSKENVYLGDYAQIWASPFDNFQNPTVIGNDITFLADDGGEFIGNSYYPKKAGIRTITASCMGVSAEIKINVLSEIANLTFYPETFTGNKGYLSVVASDSDGVKSQISPESIGWRVESGDATVSFGNIKANGKAEISATFGDKIIKTTINGEYEKIPIFDKFSASVKNPDFIVFPSYLESNTFINNVVNEKITIRSEKHKNSFIMGDDFTDTSLSYTKFFTLQNHKAPASALSSWKKLLDLPNASEQNILIYLAGGEKFCDEASKRMFDKTLIKLYNLKKNVFVLSEGDETTVDIENGVRYIKIKSPKILLGNFKNTFDAAVYLKFKEQSGNLFYEFEKIF